MGIKDDLEDDLEKIRVGRLKWDFTSLNDQILDNCSLHKFDLSKKEFEKRIACTNCGGLADSAFIIAYNQGLQHRKK